MTGGLGGLFAPENWPAFVLITTRMAGLMLIAPFWSMLGLPRTIRGALVVVLAAVLVPASPKVAFPAGALEIPLPLMSEFVVGLAIGLIAAVIQHAMILASEVIALQSGLSFGQLLTANLETGGPAISQLYGFVGLTVFVAMGGHLLLIEGLARSLTTIPPGSLAAFDGGATRAIATTASLFSDAVQIAAPVLVALTVTNLAMAILSRAVPQLNAMAMSFAVSVAVALVLFGVALPVMVRVASRWIGAIPIGVDGMVGALSGPGR